MFSLPTSAIIDQRNAADVTPVVFSVSGINFLLLLINGSSSGIVLTVNVVHSVTRVGLNAARPHPASGGSGDFERSRKYLLIK